MTEAELMDRAVRDTLVLVKARLRDWLEETLTALDPELERVTREVDPGGLTQPVLRLELAVAITPLGQAQLIGAPPVSGDVEDVTPPAARATPEQVAELRRQLAGGEAEVAE